MSLRIYKFASFVLSVAIGLLAAFSSFGLAEALFRTRTVTASAETPTMPSDPFVIRFSDDVKSRDSAGPIRLFPDSAFSVDWRDARTMILVPEGRWEPGTEYSLSFPGGKDGFLRSVSSASFTLPVPGYPSIVSFSPDSGSADVRLDIEDPLTVVFDRSAADFYVDFRLSPDMPVVYENDRGKTTFRILPQEEAEADTEYALSVFVKWRGESDDRYRFLGESRFRTAPKPPLTFADELALRVEQAKRSAPALVPDGKYVDIDLERQVMTLFEDGRAIDAYPVSTGKPGMDTPKGVFAIRNKAARPWSSAYGLYMPYWMALVPDGKFGIHELPEWPGGYKEGADHLGIPVSHGCVRLGVGPAERVYGWVDIGTPVVVH